MHPIDIESALRSMTVLVDTREQDTEQARKRYERFGVPWTRSKLDYGDYSACFDLPDGMQYDLRNLVVVERKMSLDELCGCYTHDRARFEREFERAREAGARVYLLIENASWEMAYNGKYRSRMNPQALIASMLAWMARYDCIILMCKAETSGRLIHDILYREAKERLTSLS